MLLRKICLVFSIIVTSTMSAQTLSISSNGQTGTLGANWSITGTTLTVTGTANIQASVIETALSSGNLTVVAGDIQVSQDITSNTTNVLTLKASGTIEIHDNTGIKTNGGDLILWSNSDNVNGGNVLTGQNVTLDSRQGVASTGGGHIHIAGGSDSNSDGFPDDATAGIGNFTGGSAYGILFGNSAGSGVQLLSGGGNITLIGGVDGNFNSGANSHGIGFYPGYTVDAGAGSISLTGYGNSGGANTFGIDLMTFGAQNASSISTTGDLTLNGVTTVTTNTNYGIIINTGLTVNAGTVDITGDSDDAGIILNGSVVSNGAINLKANTYSFSSGSISGQGTVSIEPLTASSSFSSAFSNSSLTLGSALTGLTIGKSTNTANVTLASSTTIAGPISIYGGDITINENLNTTAGGANGDILLKGSGNIIQADGKSITTSGGDVTLWSNSDDETTNGGYIYLLDNTTIDTRTSSDRTANDGTANDISGGAITLAGGAGTTLPTGYALNNANFFRGGINLGTESGGQRHNSNITMISGGGNIFLKGKQTSLNNGDAAGINAYEGFILDGGKTGNITLEGDVSSAGASYSDGINLGNFATTAGGTASYIKTVDGDITLTGSASDAITQSRGLTLAGGGVGLFIQSTGIGSISLSGTPGGTGVQYNILLVGANILASSGGIDLVGGSTGKIFNALFSSTIGYKTGSDILSSTSDIMVTGDDFDLSSGFNFNTTGILILKSFGNSFTNAFSTSQLTYSSDLTGLTIGKSTNTANVTISSATTIAGPITAYGGTITLNADLTTTNNGDISLYSDNPLGGLSTPRTLTAAGAFKYIPRGTSFSADVTYPITNLNASSTGLTIGNPTNDKNITINADVTGGSGIELYGNNLAINANLKTTNGAAMTLKGNATIAAGKYIESAGNFTHDGNLIFKSDINGTAAFGTLGGTYTTTSGTVIVERFIPARRAFRFLSSSVTTLGSIFENWQENGIGASGLGTHITGTGGATNGFDVTATNNPSMFGFDHATGQWAAVTNTNTNTLTAGTPYRLMVRGDRTTDLTTNTPTASVTTLRATGALHTGNFTPTLNQTAEGYSFIGNPYQAPLDMEAVLTNSATYIDTDVLYYWDPTLNTRGAYVTRTLSANTNNVSSSFTEILQPGQAVFVKKDNTANPATMTISETHKSVADGAAGVFRSTNTATDIGLLRANLQANINNQWQTTDAALALFNDSYSWNVSQEDASKMNNLDEEVSFIKENTSLAIAKQNNASETDELPIRLQQLRHTNYRWVFDLNNYNGYTPYLFDTEQNTLSVIEDGTVLPFTAGSNTSNRFKIVFQNTTLNTPTFDNQISLYPNPSNGANGFYMTNITANPKVVLFTILGQSVPVSTSLNGTPLHVKPIHEIAKGIYVVQVTSEDGATQQVKWIVE